MKPPLRLEISVKVTNAKGDESLSTSVASTVKRPAHVEKLVDEAVRHLVSGLQDRGVLPVRGTDTQGGYDHE